MSPVLFGTGKSARDSWFYFTENELTPGAARVGNYKAVFNLRGDDGAQTGGLAVDSNLGWKGAEKYVATVPQIFDLWSDPQERYDIFMNIYTERTWTLVTINEEVKNLMKTDLEYPPRKLQPPAGCNSLSTGRWPVTTGSCRVLMPGSTASCVCSFMPELDRDAPPSHSGWIDSRGHNEDQILSGGNAPGLHCSICIGGG